MKCKAVLFDFVGTCLDWHSSVVAALPANLDLELRKDFALQWRLQYFAEVRARLSSGLAVEDVDITYKRALEVTLQRYSDVDSALTSIDAMKRALHAWHNVKAWPEVATALETLRKELDCELFVHANGTVRFQLDLTRSSGLQFDLLFSSELLGHYKPAPEAYLKALQLIKLEPQNCVLVAAHAYDLRGAKAVGMKTVYIKRWTDDIDEDQSIVKTENDAYLDDMTQLASAIMQL